MKRRKKKVVHRNTWVNIVDKIILALNVLVVIATLLSYLAPSTSPRDSMLITILGFGYYFLLVANLLFIIYWLCRKRFALSIISLAVILCGITIITRFIGLHSPVVIDGKNAANQLRILDYNVKEFSGVGLYERENSKNEILKVVKKYQPDILTMQEFASLDSTAIKEFKKELKYAFAFPYKTKYELEKKKYLCTAIFSKYPIIKADSIPAPKLLGLQAVYADIKYKGTIIRCYTFRLASITIQSQERSRYLEGQGVVTNSSFITTKLANAFLQRAFQVERIKRHIDSCPYPIILSGDFNDTAISYSVNEIGQGLQNASFKKGRGFVTTYNNKFPLQIDYVMASEHFEIINHHVPNLEISDHKPVIADLKLKP